MILDSLNNPAFPGNQTSPNLAEVTRTYYDVGIAGQTNLKGRVAYVTITDTVNSTSPDGQSYYSYDTHGNVQKLTTKIKGFSDKTVNYDYDLISGKVNNVYFQMGKADRFFHRYSYDADNRITSVSTSPDSIGWEEDAHYFYYKHGPLARMELGRDKVQGLDYYYTLQGWLKGVNSPNPRRTYGSTLMMVSRDPGLDGIKTSASTGGNEWADSYVAQDEFAYGLSYYNNDYTPISAAQLGLNGSTYASNIQNGIKAHGLFNGNIVAMATQVHSLAALLGNGDDNFGIRGSAYHYDQLNRLKQAMSYSISSGTWASRSNTINSGAYDAAYAYDANGNITTASVSGSTASLIDNLSYQYNYTGGLLQNNKLTSVSDAAGNVTGTDLPNQPSNNYQYDAIGNLIKDTSEQISKINWTVYGKVKDVIRTSGSTRSNLSFIYDATGNRIIKIEKPYNYLTNSAQWKYTYYSRDASGNVMSTYMVSPGSNATEYPIYGSSRVGLYQRSGITSNAGAAAIGFRYPGSRDYELANHLGNVYVTLTGIKIGTDTTADGKADVYKASVISANDYYAFGMAVPGRSYNNISYRYGFNGKEKDSEWNSGGAEYDYGFRIYDPRLGRFLSVDPLQKDFAWNAPYSFAENDVIRCIDLEGTEKFDVHINNQNEIKQAWVKLVDASTVDGLVVDIDGEKRNNFKYKKIEQYVKNQTKIINGELFIDQYNNGNYVKSTASLVFNVSEHEDQYSKDYFDRNKQPIVTKSTLVVHDKLIDEPLEVATDQIRRSVNNEKIDIIDVTTDDDGFKQKLVDKLNQEDIKTNKVNFQSGTMTKLKYAKTLVEIKSYNYKTIKK